MQNNELILTASSKKQKEEELRRLRTVERPAIAEAIRRAREYGDLSENFEYHSARQAQAILNGRIAELEALLDRARVVDDDAAAGSDTVTVGSVVTLRDIEADDEFEVTIVDAASANPDEDRISSNSPIGRAVMGHKKGDVVDVMLPNGMAKYEIARIHWE